MTTYVQTYILNEDIIAVQPVFLHNGLENFAYGYRYTKEDETNYCLTSRRWREGVFVSKNKPRQRLMKKIKLEMVVYIDE